MTIQEALNIAVKKHEAGDLRAAESIYRQVLAQNPSHAQTLNLLGVLTCQSGRPEVGMELIGKAISLHPDQAEFHGNLGLALAELKRFDDAIASYTRALAMKPDYVQAHINLGNAHNDLGRRQEAVDCFLRAIAIQPQGAEAWYNLANVHKAAMKLDEAINAYRRTLALRPAWREAQNNLGNTLCGAGRFDEAEAVFVKALADRPNDPLAYWNVGLMRLRRGDLEGGWPLYEWRRRVPELKLRALQLAQPQWDGEELNGKRIFLHSEQGFGDTIQFIRYVPLIANRGGRIIVGAQPELMTLLRGFPNVEQWVTTGSPLPEFEVQCSLLSLPGVLKTTPATIPNQTPYLLADPAKSETWKSRLAKLSGRKVGLCWAGRPTHAHDKDRSLNLAQLQPLAQAGVSLLSLQKGGPSSQAKSAGFEILDWTQDLNDFSDTAALVDNLDLVITVDTAVAHLAAAMGKPVWMLLHFCPDWRWMLTGDRSPWYPSMRLFRQPRLGDWSTPIGRAALALGEWRAS